ncbi:hypothetical protein F511_23311 [Dorcoceras hygrometricum]|uniref:Uncharacterized protein n=1 Tax=Dorcoceras hygrometricum TaxID=472368 RepID=A0A2Z7B7Q0_9LAMI|nr:hypothetical protein F511_23311 [Dorcoceras hygrometricum]
MSLFDLQDVCIAIGSIATLDLPMIVDLIGIYGLKGPYCTLTTTNWFLQALSVIPRGSWGDVARRSYHDPLGKSGIVIPEPQWLWKLSTAPPLLSQAAVAAAAARLRRKIVSGQFDEENPFVLISSVLLVQADEGVSFLVMDRIGDFYRNLPRRADVIVTTVGARHKCQQGLLLLPLPLPDILIYSPQSTTKITSELEREMTLNITNKLTDQKMQTAKAAPDWEVFRQKIKNNNSSDFAETLAFDKHTQPPNLDLQVIQLDRVERQLVDPLSESQLFILCIEPGYYISWFYRCSRTEDLQVIQLDRVERQLVDPLSESQLFILCIEPGRDRSRIARQVEGESRAPGSDEDVDQQSVPLCNRVRQAEVEVEDVTRQIGEMELVLARRCVVLRNSSNADVAGSSSYADVDFRLATSRWVKIRRFENSAIGVFPLVAISCWVMRCRLHLVEKKRFGYRVLYQFQGSVALFYPAAGLAMSTGFVGGVVLAAVSWTLFTVAFLRQFSSFPAFALRKTGGAALLESCSFDRYHYRRLLLAGSKITKLFNSAVFSLFSYCSHCFVVVALFSYQDARASGDSTLSSPCRDLLAPMRRVGIQGLQLVVDLIQLEVPHEVGIQGLQLVVDLIQLEVPHEVQTNRQRFKPQGKQFKRRSNSSSSGSVSSGGNGSEECRVDSAEVVI